MKKRFSTVVAAAAISGIAGVLLIVVNFARVRSNHLLLFIDGQLPVKSTWLWLDAVQLNAADKEVVFDGYLWSTSAKTETFDLVSDGNVALRINSETIYERGEHGSVHTDPVMIPLRAGANRIEVRYRTATPPTPRYELSLRQAGTLLPPWRLYPDEPDEGVVERQRRVWFGLRLGIGLVAAGALLGSLAALVSLSAEWRDRMLILLVVALAIGVRIVVAYERFFSAPDFYAMDPIWDNFVGLGRQVLDGRFSLAGSYFQQGTIVYSSLTQTALGPGLLPQYILNALLGGLACGFVLAAAWLLFGRSIGFTAGILMALYAPLVHYQTTLQVVAPATFTSALAVLLSAALLQRATWARALAHGVVVGLGILVRGPLASLFVAGWLAMLFSRGWDEKAQSGRRRLLASRLLLSGVMALSMVLTVAPMAVANARVGVYAVSSNGFPIAFFRGNHRDTFGINEYLTDRERLARLRAGGEQNFVQEALLDIRADPGQWLQLLVHKAGLFWTGHEHGDGQIEFTSSGLAYSALLRLLWAGGAFSFSTLIGLGIVGALLAAAHRKHRPAPLILVTTAILFMLLTLLFPVTGRVRAPVQPLLFPLTAYALHGGAALIIALRAKPNYGEDRSRRRSSRNLAVGVVAAIALLLFVRFAEDRLPRPTIVSEARLPESLVRTEVVFDDSLRLIGFDAYSSDFRSGGYLDLTLYWQALLPLEEDYTGFLHLLDPALTRVSGIDRQLGAANFPVHLSSRWRPDEIMRQSYFIPLPDLGDQAVPLRIIVGVYDSAQAPLPISASNIEMLGGDTAYITGLSILPDSMELTTTLPRALGLSAGSNIVIVGTDLSPIVELAANAGELKVALQWSAVEHPPLRYHVFLHLIGFWGRTRRAIRWPTRAGVSDGHLAGGIKLARHLYPRPAGCAAPRHVSTYRRLVQN